MFTSCEVAFCKLNVYYVKFTNYHHIAQLSFKGINLHKLCENAILIKCILTLNNSSTHQLNNIETVTRTFDLSNSSNYRNSLASSTIIILCTILITQSPSGFEKSREISSSFFQLVILHIQRQPKHIYIYFRAIAKQEVSWQRLVFVVFHITAS